MAPRISGKARLKQPGNNSVPEMANGDTSSNNPILIFHHQLSGNVQENVKTIFIYILVQLLL